MKIRGSRYRLKKIPPEPDAYEVEREKREANIERIEAKLAALRLKIAALELKLDSKKNSEVKAAPDIKKPYVAPDRWVAVHEAGHAVCARLQGMPVFKAVVKGDNSGRVTHSEAAEAAEAAGVTNVIESEAPPASPGWYRASMLCALAGAAAQLIDNPAQFSRSVPAGAFAGDADNFFQTAYKELFLRDAPAQAWLDAMSEKGRDLDKLAIKARAEWLKVPLTMPQDIRALYNETFAEAEKLLRDNWKSVERVAGGLLQFGELDQKEIDFLIGEEKLDVVPV